MGYDRSLMEGLEAERQAGVMDKEAVTALALEHVAAAILDLGAKIERSANVIAGAVGPKKLINREDLQ
jgi:hypothetical protein